MCGVFGVANVTASLSMDELEELTATLLTESETRGSEAAGVAAWQDGRVLMKKTQSAPHRFVKQDSFRRIFDGKTDTRNAVVVGHARMVTNGSAIFDENNQPVHLGDVALVHNGIVTNFVDLANGLPTGESDTVAVAHFLEERSSDATDPERAVHDLYGALNGAATLAVMHLSAGRLLLATNTGSLYLALAADGRLITFASERRILEAALRSKIGRRLGVADVVGVPPGTGVTVDRASGMTEHFKLGEYRVRDDGHFRGTTAVRSDEPPKRETSDVGPLALQGSLTRTREFAFSVRRCKKCILPETMPFIEFDEDGVCTVCLSYRSTEIRPTEDLEKQLDGLRSGTGDPDCIVAFSGGRDSSYGLHLLVRQFGMRPITLTYDWGMVTDLARRNQARMTGALGVEHVLISADIARKRRNIGMNLRAWMRSPDLGMVPLLMAGDKQFFLHARRLSRDTGLPLVIFCINPLEATFFKSGFAGVPDQRYYTSSSGRTKAKLLGYYARQYLRNPRYINRSLLDTLEATYATYLQPHDYLQLFDWVEWDEDSINSTLTSIYGWETDPTTTTTWRIGDGTAPFYNYVYWRTVGFTENDTFRSNQVREGRITRDRALELVHSENEPRWERIEEYVGLIGVDRDDALAAIERLATRSPVGG